MPEWTASWQVFALLSAVFAALTAIFAKIGVESVNSDFATFFRTCVVVVVLGGILMATRQMQSPLTIAPRSLFFLVMSGLATGASWRSDGFGRAAHRPLPLSPVLPTYTPDDILRDRCPLPGAVMIYDDDHYYMGAVIAEKLARLGSQVTLVTPAADVSAFTVNTLENVRTARRLQDLGVRMVTHTGLKATEPGRAVLYDARTGAESLLAIAALVLVTARVPHGGLFAELAAIEGGPPVARIGDCEAPAAIFQAVYSGHRFAEEFEIGVQFRRERIDLAAASPFDLVP